MYWALIIYFAAIVIILVAQNVPKKQLKTCFSYLPKCCLQVQAYKYIIIMFIFKQTKYVFVFWRNRVITVKRGKKKTTDYFSLSTNSNNLILQFLFSLSLKFLNYSEFLLAETSAKEM